MAGEKILKQKKRGRSFKKCLIQGFLLFWISLDLYLVPFWFLCEKHTSIYKKETRQTVNLNTSLSRIFRATEGIDWLIMRLKFGVIGMILHQPKRQVLFYMGVEPKIGGKTPKWMVELMENPIKLDGLGYHYFWKHRHVFCWWRKMVWGFSEGE